MKKVIFKNMQNDMPSLQRRELLKSGRDLALTGLLLGALPLQAIYAQANQALGSQKDAMSALNTFLKDVNSLRANFVQVVTAPNSERTRTSSGTFAMSRPNRFRFDYLKPYEQLIVSDGDQLWLYDKDLEQVTQRSYSSAIASTPAALLAGAAEATLTQENFTLTPLPDADGLQWLQAKPKQEDGQIDTARLGFRDGLLEVLEITDNFRQKSTLTFTNMQVNLQIPRGHFEFEVPQGVDLINE